MQQANHHELAKFGIHIPMMKGLLEKHELAMDHSVAMDAQPSLVTESNAGIPAFLTNYMDPEVIRILTAANKAASIFGETKKGDWTTQTAMFPVVESTGEVSSYGDFNANGSVGSNINWVSRQSYLFQTMTQWGQLELARASEARIDYAQNLNIASTMILDKFMNNCYFYGVEGLMNYGLLNDPSLSAPIAPGTGVAGNTWAQKTAAEIYSDIVLLFKQLVSQTQGLADQETRMTLAMDPTTSVNLTKTNEFNVNVTDQIKKNFPNMRVETAVQYATAGGNLVQLIADSVEGENTGYCAFSEKLRAHPVVVAESSYRQKKTGGTWGAIVRLPIGIAGLLGV